VLSIDLLPLVSCMSTICNQQVHPTCAPNTPKCTQMFPTTPNCVQLVCVAKTCCVPSVSKGARYVHDAPYHHARELKIDSYSNQPFVMCICASQWPLRWSSNGGARSHSRLGPYKYPLIIYWHLDLTIVKFTHTNCEILYCIRIYSELRM